MSTFRVVEPGIYNQDDLLCIGKGELTVRNVKHALQRFSDDVVPLTVYQIHTLVSVAPVNDNGIVKYTLMVPIVERTVRAIIDLQHMKTRFYVIEQLAQSDLLTDLSQAEPEKFRELLKEAFQRADSNNSGTLTGTITELSNSSFLTSWNAFDT